MANFTTSGDATKLLQGDTDRVLPPPSSTKMELHNNLDIAQSHFYTVKINGIRDAKGNIITLSSGRDTYKNYTPIKNMTLNYTSYENLSIPVAIFGDFALLNQKKISTFSFSCYDFDDDRIELSMRRWEMRCFPQEIFVAYLADVAEELIYTSYNTKGKINFTRRFYVIPASSVNVSRGYEDNSAKMVNFSLAVVGEPGASANGSSKSGAGKTYGEYGEGVGPGVDIVFERNVTAAISEKDEKSFN